MGFDGSEIAERAIREAGAVLRPGPALVVVVYEQGIAFQSYPALDVQAVPIDPHALQMADEAMYESARHTAARGAAIARELGFAAEPLVAADEGSVGSTLLRLANDRDASAVVVGAHRYGRVERIVMGSTSRQVLEHARCPVLVVRSPEG